jgi:hypothetical protein
LVTFVALLITLKLRNPEIQFRLRKPAQRAALMTVPKTPVDEDGFFSSREYQIRVSRKMTLM